MTEMPISQIESWHAHVYFDDASKAAALALRKTIETRFQGAMEMGRFHERPVGPHPRWSYQVAFRPEHFASILPWLSLNRGDLVVFVHPNTGDALGDHRDRAVWLGAKLDLDLDALKG